MSTRRRGRPPARHPRPRAGVPGQPSGRWPWMLGSSPSRTLKRGRGRGGENAAPASPLHVIPHLDEVAVGIAEVDRADGAFGAGGFDRAELDVDAAAPPMVDNGLPRDRKGVV